MAAHRHIQLLLVAASLAFDRTAWSQPRCFQRVGGVPGAYGQPPDWWSPGATPLVSGTGRFVDDPRWRGASSFSHVSDTARFQALVETVGAQRFLVMSWHIRADAMASNDRLYVGFWDETAAQGNVFRIEKTQTTATPVNGGTYATGAFNGRFFHKLGGGGWLLNNAGGLIPPPLPTWLKNDTRLDLFCVGAVCDEWAVRMRIPIDPAADVSTNDPTGVKITAGGLYRFWYQIQDGLSLGTSVAYGWPEGASVAQEGNPPCTAIPPNCFPDPMDVTNPWNQVQDGTTCNGDIGMLPGQIYANTPGSITVSLSSANAFHARPTNLLATAQPGNAIQGTFRLANWGSAVGVSPQWTPICTGAVGAAGSVASLGQFDLTCNYTVADPCAFKPSGDPCGPQAGSRTTDQCVLVDLASAGGSGPYFFSPQSAWQNMSFTGASRIVRAATLDARGLPALATPAPNRDLYVYVKTRNLPQSIGNQPPVDVGRLPPETRERLAKVAQRAGRTVDSKTADLVRVELGAGRLAYSDVEAIMPTYVAYVWHDTGRTIATEAGSRTLLGAQPSFGIFTWHDGDLNGWRTAFEGQTVTPIGPNFYKVSVPTNGTVTVTTRITACEWPICLDHHLAPMWLWLILIVILLLVAILIVFRRRAAGP